VDVARAAGVSKGLVSLAINDRPGVAEATRVRVRAVADELGWRPSRPARTLSTSQTYAYGLVLRRDLRIVAADPFYPAFMAGIETVLTEHGRVLVLSVVGDEAAEERAYRTLAADRRVDGVFLNDLRHDDHRVPLLQELGIPAVLVGRPDGATPFPCVVLDDTLGVRAAVHHLADLGHREIAYVAGDPALLHARHRRSAFEEAVAGHGLTPAAVIDTDFSMAGGAAATATLLAGATRPTAIVYANDPMAITGVGVLQEAGIDVPGAISVVGFDGTELARHTHPPLTTVRSDPQEWGAAAARTLLTLTTTGTAPDVELPPAQLVTARSTGPAPGRSTSTPALRQAQGTFLGPRTNH
jgi:DNA-binding LacI/PurR family transcriptional regulator